MIDVEDSVNLGHVPPQPSSEFCLGDAVGLHALVKQHLDGGECWHRHATFAARRRRNVLPAVDPRGNRLLDGVDSP